MTQLSDRLISIHRSETGNYVIRFQHWTVRGWTVQNITLINADALMLAEFLSSERGKPRGYERFNQAGEIVE